MFPSTNSGLLTVKGSILFSKRHNMNWSKFENIVVMPNFLHKTPLQWVWYIVVSCSKHNSGSPNWVSDTWVILQIDLWKRNNPFEEEKTTRWFPTNTVYRWNGGIYDQGRVVSYRSLLTSWARHISCQLEFRSVTFICNLARLSFFIKFLFPLSSNVSLTKVKFLSSCVIFCSKF